MSKKFHISISTENFDGSVKDYSNRLNAKPEVVVPGRYALWRTEILNFSISCKPGQKAGMVRHIGFEDGAAEKFVEEQDINGIIWEYFSEAEQKREIKEHFGV